MADADDKLDFCKQALGELGTRSTITSLDPPDGSQEAYYCNLFFDGTRDQVLRAAHWNFAGRTEVGVLWKALPGTPENQTVPINSLWTNHYPAPPWLYSYSFPTDISIQIRRLREQASPAGVDTLPLYPGSWMGNDRQSVVQFEIASDRYSTTGVRLAVPVRVILTNARNALIDFTTSDVVVAEYDSLFADAFMLALEGKLALALIGDKGTYQAKLQEANISIINARVRDGNEGLTVYEHVPDWLQARGVSSMSAPTSGWYNPPYGPLFAV